MISRWDWIAALVCALAGGAIGTFPHSWTGNAAWMADYDDFAFYRPLAVLNSEQLTFQLEDPSTGGASYFPWLPIQPALLIGQSLGASPSWAGLLWRGLNGLAIGLLWFTIARSITTVGISIAFALWMMTDPGILQAQLLYSLVLKYKAWVAGHLESKGLLLPQWRILNPVQSWPWLLFVHLALIQLVRTERRLWLILAAISFGLLYYVYFYYWTAVGLGLLLAGLLQRDQRWNLWKVMILGTLIGLPSVWNSTQFRAIHGHEWMHRSDKFLPVERFSELLVPKIAFLVFVICAVLIWKLAPRWRWLIAFCLASLLLLNQTIITGLMIENFHWYYSLSPSLCILVLVSVLEVGSRLPDSWATRAKWVAYGVTAVVSLAGLVLLAGGIDRSHEAKRIQQAVETFRVLSEGWQPERGLTLAGPDDFQYAAANQLRLRPLAGYTAILSPMGNDELDHRVALNSWLQGKTRHEFEKETLTTLGITVWGPEGRSAQARQERLARRLAAWDQLDRLAPELIEKYRICAVVVPVGQPTDRLQHWKLWRADHDNRLFVQRSPKER